MANSSPIAIPISHKHLSFLSKYIGNFHFFPLLPSNFAKHCLLEKLKKFSHVYCFFGEIWEISEIF